MHTLIKLIVIGSCQHQHLAVQQLRMVFADNHQPPIELQQRFQLWQDTVRHQRNAGSGAYQKARLAQGHITTANQQHVTLAQVKKQR